MYWRRSDATASNGYWTESTYNNYRRTTETTNWIETVIYTVTYRYETAVITETSTGTSFELTNIAHEQDGTVNLADRTYTVSSWTSAGNGAYTFQQPDNVTFTNTRKVSTLTVTKSVVNGDAGDQFGFVVTLDAALTGFSADGVTVSADGKHLTFKLVDGGSKALDLPVGIGYSVAEDYNAKYSASSENASGTLGMDSVTAAFTNTRKADLSITVNPKTVYYNAAEQTGYGIDNVTGVGGNVTDDAYTVSGLQNGDVLTVVGYVVARGTEAGTYDGNFGNAIITITRNGDDVTATYNLTNAAPGSLTINKTPILVTVTATSKEVSYNGEEQEYDGAYEYTIKNTLTQETVSDSSITVAVGPDYRLARGTNAGTYPMHFDSAGAVTVNASASYEVSVAVVNGNLVITRAPVTVTADDNEKFVGQTDPTLGATATGLFGSDTVSYSVTRAAGEAIGTYAITASGAAEQGNYTVTYVNGTFTIKGLPELIQRATGTGLEVSVSLTDELLTTAGLVLPGDTSTDTVSEFLSVYDYFQMAMAHFEHGGDLEAVKQGMQMIV